MSYFRYIAMDFALHAHCKLRKTVNQMTNFESKGAEQLSQFSRRLL
jgi:hypothetical protein